MDTSMVLPMAFCLSLPLWAREGTPLAPTQSQKQAQLLRYNQKSEVGLFSVERKVVSTVVTSFANLVIPFTVSWPSSTPCFASLSLHQSLPKRATHLITFSLLVPVVLHLYLKWVFLMLLPRLFQIYMVFLILWPRCCYLCKIVLPKRCPILFSNRLWSLTVSCLTPTGHPWDPAIFHGTK